MKTYLLAWKPIRSEWDDLPEISRNVKEGKGKPICWSCGKSKRPQKGDRIFLIKLGKKPKGIFASGYIVRGSYEDTHWDYEKARSGQISNFVKVQLDTLLNPEVENILSRELLDEPPLSEMYWDTQMSGVQIPDNVAKELEILWESFTNSASFTFPEEVEQAQSEIFEGAVKRVSVNAYERSPEARRKCIEHYGVTCQICGFNFEKTYGNAGKDFIHVHHLKQISEIGETYQIDPIQDLRPVCPNCHAIIHKRTPSYTIEEVKDFLKR
jgi:5-methylcytosine-specific restriction enzyme A